MSESNAGYEGYVDVDTLPDKAPDGFTLHRCECCRYRTVLGSHGFDSSGKYCYKIIVRERCVIIYFGAFIVSCKDCKRWHRVRILPRENKVQMKPLPHNPA